MATALKIVHNDTLWLLLTQLHILTRITLLAAALLSILRKGKKNRQRKDCVSERPLNDW